MLDGNIDSASVLYNLLWFQAEMDRDNLSASEILVHDAFIANEIPETVTDIRFFDCGR